MDTKSFFNIEKKYVKKLVLNTPYSHSDGIYENPLAPDLNTYVDSILRVVFEPKAEKGNREIVFSSFNPDICAA